MPIFARLLGASFVDAMSRTDPCPCGNTQPPDAAIPRGDKGWLIHYDCADCERTWTSEWEGRNGVVQGR